MIHLVEKVENLGRFVRIAPAFSIPNFGSYKPMEFGYAMAGISINETIQ